MVDLGHDETDALDKLKLSAAGVGCDGLIVGAVRFDHPTSFGAGQVNGSGTCIMFEQDR